MGAGLKLPGYQPLPKLAEVLGVTVDELMQVKIKPKTEKKSWENILDRILKAVPLAMGLALIVISILDKDLGIQDIARFAGIGLFGISLYLLRKGKE